MTYKEPVGYVDVDSGGIILGDACYFLPDKRDNDKGLDYMDLFEGLDKDGYFDDHEKRHSQPLEHKNSLIQVQAGFGDGTYPVYVEYSDEGTWGKRVKSVTVVFISDEDEED